MLFKFKSKVTGDLIMLEPNGLRILEIMGKSPDAQGIIQPVQMHMAIVAIEAVITQEEAQREELTTKGSQALSDESTGEMGSDHDTVSLRQRAQPMLEMLRRCQRSDADIVWGV
jgi:hypothetical protein